MTEFYSQQTDVETPAGDRALRYALTIVANRLVLVFEVRAEHDAPIVACLKELPPERR